MNHSHHTPHKKAYQWCSFLLTFVFSISILLCYPAYGESLPKGSISHYTPLKSYYKKELTRLKKANPKVKAIDLYDQAYFDGLKAYLSDYVTKNVNSYNMIGLSLPKTPIEIDVRPGIGPTSFISSIEGTGRDRLVVFSNTASFDRLKHDVSRETFRWLASKNPKFNSTNSQNRWLLSMISEAAPKYGAYRSDKNIGNGIRQDFFRSPLTFDPNSEDPHKFQAAHFLRFIDRDADLFEFESFWQNLSQYSELDGLRSLEAAVSVTSGNTLFHYYRRFLQYLIFSAGSPVVFPSQNAHSVSVRDPYTNGLSRNTTYSEMNGGLQISPLVEGNYTADLWSIPIQLDPSKKKNRTISIKSSVPMTERTAIDIYRTKKNYRSARKAASISEGNTEAQFSVQNGDKLYVFISNGSTRAQCFPLTFAVVSE